MEAYIFIVITLAVFGIAGFRCLEFYRRYMDELDDEDIAKGKKRPPVWNIFKSKYL
jgi:hypothetical protein